MQFKEWFYLWEARKFGPLKHMLPKADLRMYSRELDGTMSSGKVSHSLNVAKNVARLSGDPDAVKAALFHDFLERGGNAHALEVKMGLSPRVIHILDALSNEEKAESDELENAPLEHIRSVLSTIKDPATKNIIILIKLSDRIDNLTRRLPRIGKNYLFKSKELVKFLISQYTGEVESMMIVRRKLKVLGVKIKKSSIAGYGNVA